MNGNKPLQHSVSKLCLERQLTERGEASSGAWCTWQCLAEQSWRYCLEIFIIKGLSAPQHHGLMIIVKVFLLKAPPKSSRIKNPSSSLNFEYTVSWSRADVPANAPWALPPLWISHQHLVSSSGVWWGMAQIFCQFPSTITGLQPCVYLHHLDSCHWLW